MTIHILLGILTAVMVCHCEAVNDAAVCSEIEAGAHDADAVAERCGAGSQCGGCQGTIEDLLRRFALAPDPVAA